MSVYIKGFPLPNNCGACPLRLAWCRERIYMVTRPECCPLVPVPEHGRLIDADALIAWFEEWYDPNADLEICHVIDILDDNSVTPTIIPASTADKEGEG